jgi:uncharacterized protein
MAPSKASLPGRLISFADFLRGRGFRVFQSGVLDALRSLEKIDLGRREDFFHALRSNLTATDLEWAQFQGLFDEFWKGAPEEDRTASREESVPREKGAEAPVSDGLEPSGGESQGAADLEGPKEWLEGMAFSRVSRLEKKDLSHFESSDIQIAQLALKKMIAPFKVQVSRRRKRSGAHGHIDFPRSMRKALKAGGIPVELFYREKKRRLKRLVVLADVSGSMERYARFVMPFIMGLRGVGSRAEVFVFSTSLTSITFMVRHLSLEKALERISHEVPDWSGGTRIGHSLHQFNQGYGRKLLGRRSVVVILSDGWDLGAKHLLKREMENLSGRAYCVIWLNPLAGAPGYEPVCQGMKIALPYVDHFLPADSLESLKRVGRLLSRVMMH